MSRSIDLNADIGEGSPWDLELLEIVTSASIACGAHAGDEETMRATVRAATERGVSIGAHPGYPDRENFGRRELNAPAPQIRSWLAEQVETLARICDDERATLKYVKPHGALYNTAWDDDEVAAAIVDSVQEWKLPLLCPADSAMERAAKESGIRVVTEAFADRAYLPSGRLVPRNRRDALVPDTLFPGATAVEIVVGGRVRAVTGTIIPMRADSLCVHGDTPGAVAIARSVKTALIAAGAQVRAFA